MSLIFKARLLVALSLALLCLQCQAGANGDRSADSKSQPSGNAPVAKYGYQIVNMFPHDSNAFTQGLILSDGKLLESTGQEGSSSLRRVELETGKVLNKVDVPVPYFAEGITLLNGKIYQLTWQNEVGFIYDAQSFERVGQFKYSREGWGLATDGKSLILSDGSSRIRFLDPTDFHVTKTINVVDGQTPVRQLNELEFVQGEIYANVWHDNRIATIDPNSGRVTAWIDLNGLMPEGELQDPEAVLNGIAYDQANDKLYVTGKLWPRIFEIRVKK
ncbi:MAG TPA: glutaminyl-peptide cyclotransferase [Pyrinomonadaceae bacterium]|jgi:glutamine cyclotransferase|nr:glutaminyl-peptide cyclotransferase [Pyrinomonadaceae bacterium]